MAAPPVFSTVSKLVSEVFIPTKVLPVPKAVQVPPKKDDGLVDFTDI